MPITTSISPSYGIRMLFIGVLMLAFAAWGAYDYWVKIPNNNRIVQKYEAAKKQFDELEQQKNNLQSSGMTLAELEQFKQRYEAAVAELNSLTPGGAPPVPSGKWDPLTCWIFMSCLPCAPYFFYLFMKAKRQKYTLDEDGTLRFEGDPQHGNGTWTRADIADIDMSRWMRKSIAYAVHQNGTRLKLDAYLHRNLDMIIGAIASGLHPTEWDVQAKPIKDVPAGEVPVEATDSATAEAAS